MRIVDYGKRCRSEGALATEESAKKRGAATKGKLIFDSHGKNLPVNDFQPWLVHLSAAKVPLGDTNNAIVFGLS